MPSLVELNNKHTDKNTIHSYLTVYDELFNKKKDSATHVLEVGIHSGGSLLLWKNYFKNATIYGIDIIDKTHILEELKNDNNIVLHTQTNAYDSNFVNKAFEDVKFDIVLDDGPHTLQSMIDFIILYSPLLKDNGILIIEDVQDITWLNTLIENTPEHLKKCIKTYDRRSVKGRYDDIIFVIDLQ